MVKPANRETAQDSHSTVKNSNDFHSLEMDFKKDLYGGGLPYNARTARGNRVKYVRANIGKSMHGLQIFAVFPRVPFCNKSRFSIQSREKTPGRLPALVSFIHTVMRLKPAAIYH